VGVGVQVGVAVGVAVAVAVAVGVDVSVAVGVGEALSRKELTPSQATVDNAKTNSATKASAINVLATVRSATKINYYAPFS